MWFLAVWKVNESLAGFCEAFETWQRDDNEPGVDLMMFKVQLWSLKKAMKLELEKKGFLEAEIV